MARNEGEKIAHINYEVKCIGVGSSISTCTSSDTFRFYRDAIIKSTESITDPLIMLSEHGQ